MKRILLFLLFAIILALVLIFLGLFVIGEPVDGNQLYADIEEGSGVLHIYVGTPESAIALRDVRQRRDGDQLFISLRKVLVSPLFPLGSAAIDVDVHGIRQVYLGGNLIWSAQQSQRPADK